MTINQLSTKLTALALALVLALPSSALAFQLRLEEASPPSSELRPLATQESPVAQELLLSLDTVGLEEVSFVSLTLERIQQLLEFRKRFFIPAIEPELADDQDFLETEAMESDQRLRNYLNAPKDGNGFSLKPRFDDSGDIYSVNGGTEFHFINELNSGDADSGREKDHD